MTNWFYMIDDEVIGPVAEEEMVELRSSGVLDPDSQVRRENSDEWNRYEEMLKTTPALSDPADVRRGSDNRIATAEAARHTKTVVSDLRAMNFKREILPIDGENFDMLRKDFVFWSVALIGVVPLFLVTLTQTHVQLAGFCLFFAILWGFIFKKFVIEDDEGWRIPLASLFFTGVVGINLLVLVYGLLPDAYVSLPNSPNLIVMMIGSVFQTGISEELCKSLPVFGYLLWKRRAARPLTIIVVGVFSGLGFAAFENVTYAHRQILLSTELTVSFGAAGLEEGVQGAMVNVMLRSMSLVFGHAIFSGIFAYFIALAFVTKERVGALVLVGLLVAATVHGCYNALWRIQTTLPALVMVVAFVLFYAYLTKLRLAISAGEADVSFGKPANSPGSSHDPGD